MKPKLRSICMLTALSIGTLYSQVGNWINVGPLGGSFYTLAADPQNPGVIYAGTDTGVFKSKDRGASWNNSGLNGFGVAALIVDPQNSSILYARATGPDIDGDPIRILKSIDGGASWNQLTSGLPDCCVESLAIDPSNTGTLYAIGSPSYALDGAGQLLQIAGKLFKSTNGGATWLAIYEYPVALPFVSLAIDPKTSGTLYAAAYNTNSNGSAAVYKSVDGGMSWKEADSGFPSGPYALSLSIDQANPANIYAATSGGGVYKTTDGAANWRAVNSGLPVQIDANGSVPFHVGPLQVCCIASVVVDAQDSNTLYVPSGNNALFKSTDGGASWNAVNPGLDPGLFLVGTSPFLFDPQSFATIYASTSNGLYRSTDGGVSFAAYSQARATAVYSVALAPQHSGVVLAGNSKSTDAGMSWTLTDTNFGDWVVTLAFDPGNPNSVFGGTGDEECGGGTKNGVFRSEDAGTSWANTMANIGCLSDIVFDPKAAETVYAASWNNGINKSIDGGNTWISINFGLPWPLGLAPAVFALGVDPQTAGTLYAVTHGVYKSTDGGAHWFAANTGIPDSLVAADVVMAALAVNPQTPNTVYAAFAFFNADGGLWKSIDAGASWQNVFPANVYALAIDPQNTSTVYAGTDGGVARSTDGGATWSIIPCGPEHVRVLALDPQDPTTMYAGGPGGLFAMSSAPMLLSVSGDATGQGAIQHAGTYQLVSPTNPAVAGEVLVIYCSGLHNGSGIAPQISIGGKMTDVLWFGDTPGYTGLNQVNVRVPNSVTPGPAAPVRMAYAGRPSNEVTIAVQ